MINIWIIWTGSIANDCHAPAVKLVEWIELCAILSRDEVKWKQFLAQHDSGQWQVYTSIEKFADDKSIDLVIICAPDRLHAQQAIACMKKWKHVLLEKPMATSIDDAQELQQVATKNNVVLSVGFHLRSHNGHRLLYDKIQQWKIWALRHIRIIWAFPQVDDSNWRAKKDLAKWWSLAAVGAHCIDLARWFSNDSKDWAKFSSVISNNIWNGPHDESAVISAQLQSGSTVEITSSVQFGPYTRIELFWDKWNAICEWTLGRYGWGEIIMNNIPLDFELENPFVSQLQNIVDSINKKFSLRTGGEVWIRNVQDLLLAHDV